MAKAKAMLQSWVCSVPKGWLPDLLAPSHLPRVPVRMVVIAQTVGDDVMCNMCPTARHRFTREQGTVPANRVWISLFPVLGSQVTCSR